MNAHTLLAPLIVAAVAGACRGEPTGTAPSSASSVAGSAAKAPDGSAQAALDRLDKRIPVPLLAMMANHQKQNMRDHLVAVQEIVAGASAGDFTAVEKAAGRIGFSEPMGQMCSHMGAGAPGFTEQALEFHHTADGIADAARRKDLDGVWRALGETLATCTGCHAAWKQRVVDEREWSTLTASAAPTMHEPKR